MKTKYVVLMGLIMLSGISLNADPTEVGEDLLTTLVMQLEELVGPQATRGLLEKYPQSTSLQDLLKQIVELRKAGRDSKEFQEMCKALENKLNKLADPIYSLKECCLEQENCCCGYNPNGGVPKIVFLPFTFVLSTVIGLFMMAGVCSQ